MYYGFHENIKQLFTKLIIRNYKNYIEIENCYV